MGALISSEQRIYDKSVSEAKSFEQLASYYQSPRELKSLIYDLTNQQNLPLAFVGNYEYFARDKKDLPGFALGQLRSATDGFGNQINYKYFANKPNQIKSILESQTTYIRGYGKSTTAKSSEPVWLNKTVTLDNQSYQVSLPYITSIKTSADNNLLRKFKFDIDRDPNSPTYGHPLQSIESLENDNPYLKNNSVISKKDDSIIVSSSTALLEDDSQGRSPKKNEGMQLHYNQYGALIKKVNPINGDTITYDSYDALGRVTQVTFLPANNVQYKQVQKYHYQLVSEKGQGGHLVTSTMITPTTGEAGYQSKSYYTSSNKLFKTEQQTQDRSEFFVTQENYYNSVDKLARSVAHHYDHKDQAHPQTTKYFYNEKQELVAIQQPDGSTKVTINDLYHQRAISYTLKPTGNTISNQNSLCFNPMESKGSAITSNSCKISKIAVVEKKLKNTNTPQIPLWQETNNYHYSIIADPKHSYVDEHGKRHKLYDPLTQKKLKGLLVNLAQGKNLNSQELNRFVSEFRDKCLAGQCLAANFINVQLNALKQPFLSEDLVSRRGTKTTYNSENPTQIDGKTYYIRDENGSLQAIRTHYFEYDRYGNNNKTYIADGDYSTNADKVLIGERSFSGLGYLLSATSLVNDENNKMQFSYDTTTGLPIEMVDLEGNKIVTHYEDPVWKAKPSSIDFYGKSGKKEYTVSIDYNVNGDLSKIVKMDDLNKQTSQIIYRYHPVTSRLESTQIVAPNGRSRTLISQQSKYFTNTLNTYQADGTEILKETVERNHFGLPMATHLEGKANITRGAVYNPDLSVKKATLNGQPSKDFSYDNLGRLTKIDNLHQGSVLRSYAYGYNRLGLKSHRMAVTEHSPKTEYRYGYSKLGQLESFQCEGGECPKNLFGQTLIAETYQYDKIFNRLEKVSENLADGQTQTTQYFYENQDPTQVSRITYGENKATEFKYDKNGNVIQLDKVNKESKQDHYQFTYDAGQNVVALDKNGKKITYGYDALGQQISTSHIGDNGSPQTQYNYYFGSLHEQTIGDDSRYYLGGGSVHAQEYQPNLSDGFHVTGSVQTGKVIGNFVYTPFGAKSDLENSQKLALSIQQTNQGYRTLNSDSLTGWQFFGDGYRAYDAQLRLFTKHDSASPFGAGGINAYNYAGNDPINFFDPSGHASMGDAAQTDRINSEIEKHYSKVAAIMAISAIVSFVIGTTVGFLVANPWLGIAITFIASSVVSLGIVWATFGSQAIVDNFGMIVGTLALDAVISIGFAAGGFALGRFLRTLRKGPASSQGSGVAAPAQNPVPVQAQVAQAPDPAQAAQAAQAPDPAQAAQAPDPDQAFRADLDLIHQNVQYGHAPGY